MRRSTKQQKQRQRQEHRQTNAKKFAFLDRLRADPDLGNSAKIAAWALVNKFHNTRTGQCNPSVAAIANAIGRKSRAVFVAIDELKSKGWMIVDSTGGGGSRNTNRYKFDWDRGGEVPVSEYDTSDQATEMATETDEGVSDSTPVGMSETTGVDQDLEMSNEIDDGMSSTTGMSETTGVSSPAYEPLSPLRGEEEEGPTGPPAGAGAGAEEKVAEEKFERLRQIWSVKPHAMNVAKARRAFDTAVAAGYDPDDILASAQRWVEATPPQYLRKLEVWLSDEFWLQPPEPQLAAKRPGAK